MNHEWSKRGEPSNQPAGGDMFTSMLEAMSVSELTEALSHTLAEASEENYAIRRTIS